LFRWYKACAGTRRRPRDPSGPNISAGTALIGAYQKNSNTGAAYVFVRSGTTWSQQQKLTAPDGAAGDDFGFSATLSGSTAIAGAPGAGAAYVFVRSGATWSSQDTLTVAHAPMGAAIGGSVALSGSTAALGAYGGPGAVYVFGRSGGTWSELADLTPSDGDSSATFGVGLAISTTTAMVGAWMLNQSGTAYVFDGI
jgi:hypothetical protein